jgi:hypothetical protein
MCAARLRYSLLIAAPILLNSPAAAAEHGTPDYKPPTFSDSAPPRKEARSEPDERFYGPLRFRNSHFIYPLIHQLPMESAFSLKKGKWLSETQTSVTDGVYRGRSATDSINSDMQNNWTSGVLRRGTLYGLEGLITLPQIGYDSTFNYVRNNKQMFGNRPKPGRGDLIAGVKWQFWSDFEARSALALRSSWKFPTAPKTQFLGTGKQYHDPELALLYSHHFDAFAVHAMGSYIELHDPDSFTQEYHLEKMFSAGLGVEYPTSWATWIGQVQGNTNPLPRAGIDDLDEPAGIALVGGRRPIKIWTEMLLEIGLGWGLTDHAPDSMMHVGIMKSF